MQNKFHLLGLIALLYASVHLAFDIVPLLGYLSITHKFKPTFYVDVVLWLVLLSGSITLLSGRQWGKWLILFSLSTAAILDIINIIHKNPFHTNMPLVLNILLVILFLFVLWRKTITAIDNENDTEKSKFDMIYGSFIVILFVLLMLVLLTDKWLHGLPIVRILFDLSLSSYSFNIAVFMSIILTCTLFERHQWHLILFSLFMAIWLFIYDYGILVFARFDENILVTLSMTFLVFSVIYSIILAVIVIQWFFFERKKFEVSTQDQIQPAYQKHRYNAAYLLIVITIILLFWANDILPNSGGFVYSIVVLILALGCVQFFALRERSSTRLKLKILAVFNLPLVLVGIVIPQETSVCDGIYPKLSELSDLFSPLMDLYILLFIVFATQWFFFERQKINETS